jgi:Tfp pilus assembly protein PilF
MIINIFAVITLLSFISSCSAINPREKKVYREGYRAGIKNAYQDLKRQVNGEMPLPVDTKKTGDHAFQTTFQEHINLADQYLAQGDYIRAFIHYTKALEIRPEQNDIRYRVGVLYLEHGLWKEAKAQFQRIIEQDRSHALAYQGMGMALMMEDSGYDNAKDNFRKAIKYNPKLWQAHNFLGIIHNYQKKFDQAIEEYQAAIAIKPREAMLYNNLGISYYLQGKYEEAVRLFNKAIGMGSTEARVYNNMGLALGGASKYIEALEMFKKGGSEAQAYNNLGCVYLKHRKYREANRAFKKAIELNPNFYARANGNLEITEKFVQPQTLPTAGKSPGTKERK